MAPWARESKLLYAFLFAFRALNALAIRTYFAPDEAWQSLEVAHVWAFRSGELTWEWAAGLRGTAHVLPFAVAFRALGALGLDSRRAVMVAPKLIQAALAARGDLAVLELARASTGSERAAWLALTAQLLSWFNLFCLTRTYSNSAEASLVAIGMTGALRAAPRATGASRAMPGTAGAAGARRHLGWLLAASLCVAARPSSAPLWAAVGSWAVAREARGSGARGAWALATLGLSVGVVVQVLSTSLDRLTAYPSLVWVPLNFFRFNVAEGGAALYGVSPPHWLLSQGIPGVLGPYLLLLAWAIWEGVARLRRGRAGGGVRGGGWAAETWGGEGGGLGWPGDEARQEAPDPGAGQPEPEGVRLRGRRLRDEPGAASAGSPARKAPLRASSATPEPLQSLPAIPELRELCFPSAPSFFAAVSAVSCSLTAHKEHRFLLPALQLAMPALGWAGAFVCERNRGRPSGRAGGTARLAGLARGVARPTPRAVGLGVLLALQLPLASYFCLIHQRGQVAVLDDLYELARTRETARGQAEGWPEASEGMPPRPPLPPTTALFLTPCHATAWRSSLHGTRLRLRFLDCSPPPFRERVAAMNEAERDWWHVPLRDQVGHEDARDLLRPPPPHTQTRDRSHARATKGLADRCLVASAGTIAHPASPTAAAAVDGVARAPPPSERELFEADPPHFLHTMLDANRRHGRSPPDAVVAFARVGGRSADGGGAGSAGRALTLSDALTSEGYRLHRRYRNCWVQTEDDYPCALDLWTRVEEP